MPDIEHIREILNQFGPNAVLDIALIAAAIYGALRLVSGTRASTQARGALVLFLLALTLGRLFNLTVVNYLVRNSLPALLVAGAVIFQPELRRGLDRLGRTGIRGWNRAEHAEVVDSLTKAAVRMSIERHGGLFVVERTTGLQDVISTGIRVDARISPELLAGIFYPNSPMHDMAVVLRDDRVVAAGCLLPLTAELPTPDRNLGTRHRAAIGITEQTDAFSLVVSEETGEISLALGGRLLPVPDERRLRVMLEMLYDRATPTRVAEDRDGRAPI